MTTSPTVTLHGFDPAPLFAPDTRGLWVTHDTPEMFDLAYAIEGAGGLALIAEVENKWWVGQHSYRPVRICRVS